MPCRQITEAKARFDLVSLIGAHIKLTQEGREWKGLCPFHCDKFGNFRVVPDSGIYYCYGCNIQGDALTWLTTKEGISFRQAVEKGLERPIALPEQRHAVIRTVLAAAKPAPSDTALRQRRLEQAQKIWEASVPATGTLAERYLFSRGIVFKGKLPEALRFHPSVLHEPTRLTLPAMIAAVRDINGQFTGVFRTYLASDGSGKATVARGGAKRMLGDCHGCYVQLTGVADHLAIAEGIETALSVSQSCPELNIWASMAIGNLKAPVPRTAKNITLCADSDNKDPHIGERLLKEAAREHMQRGHSVFVARAPRGMDFNDLLLAEQT